MRRTYGVVWREGDEPLARGKLELLARALRLDGLSGTGPVSREIAYEGLAGVHVGRSPAERLNGQSTLVLEPASGASISLAAVAQPGIVGELAERLAELRLATGTKTAILLPLQEGVRAEARALLESGPPFDPAETRLERHEVYLGEREALFVFESPLGVEALEPLLEEAGFWRRAAAWGDLLDGAPRVVEGVYSWSKPRP
jgi:hypothetical protein